MRVLLLLGSLASVAARSAGLVATADTYGCNPLVGKWGCTNFTPDPTDGHRAGCSDPGLPSQFSGTVMWWTGKPKVSSNYTLRTADGVPASDPTTYIPGERMTLYLRVLAPRAQYRGLLLYAVNVNETKVGDWILPFEDDPQFGRFNNIICPKSVMHVTADEKAYLEAFTFVAPPSGTGRITFRALVKTGSPNPTFSGDFLWPVKNLTLTEAVGAPPSQWSVLPAGVNCNTYCQNQSLVCTPASLGNLGTEMAAAVQRVFPCHPAVFSSCNSGPSADTTGGTNFCTFHDTQAQCTTDARTYTAPSCTAVSSALKPLFCFCGQYVPPPTVPPTVAVVPTNAPAPTTVGTPTTAPAPTVPGSTGSPTVAGAPTTPQAPTTAQIAAAGKTSASLFGLLIGAFALVATSQSRASFGVMFVLCIAMTANAHNYIEGTRGRAPTANTIQPTFPQIAREEIHMQVLAGQEFMIEWAAAHNDDTYIVILAAEDEAMLRRHNRTSLTDYLNNAPTNATAAALDPKWAKYHRVAYNVDIKTNQTMGTSIAANAIFQDIIPRESPYYLGDRPAPPIFPARFCTGSGPGFNMSIASGKFCNESLQFSHKLSAQAKDARASYVSAKYPWIEAVMRFSNQGFVHGVAATRITIPARKGAGRYIIHYLWSSYRDNWDVDVKTTGGAVVNPYGTLSNYTPYSRADHCVFQDARGFGSSCLQVFDSYNTSQCKAACDSDGSCKGYGVVPLGGGPLFPSYSPIPWGAPGSQCDKALFAGLPASTQVCYTVTNFVDNAAGSVPPWTFFTDTLDVGFYSTCYIKLDAKNWDRPVAAPPAQEPAPYRFKDRCVPCSHRFQNNMLQVPSWEVSRSCVNCDLEPDTLPPRPAVPAWTGPEQTNKFFSYTNCTTSPCFKWLAPAGSAYAFEEECRILAKSTTACSKYVAFSRLRPRSTTVVNKRGKWTPADLNVTLSSTGLRYHTCACWTDKVRAPVYVNTTAAFSQVIGTTTGDFAIWQMN